MEPKCSLPFTSAHHLSLSWARSIQSTPPHLTSWRSTLILSYHLSLGLSKCILSLRFPNQNSVCTSPQFVSTTFAIKLHKTFNIGLLLHRTTIEKSETSQLLKPNWHIKQSTAVIPRMLCWCLQSFVFCIPCGRRLGAETCINFKCYLRCSVV